MAAELSLPATRTRTLGELLGRDAIAAGGALTPRAAAQDSSALHTAASAAQAPSQSEAETLAALEINDLVLDSRDVRPGAAFVALPGARQHGLDFAALALARGAAVVLYEPSATPRAIPAPSVAVPHLKNRLGELARAFFGASKSRITGVTGTNGKTTVAYLISQAMTAREHRCAYIGTLGFGVAPTLASHALTTPDCLTLHRELAALDTPFTVMEVSSHALEQDRIAGLAFETAVFTNLTRDHLDQHGDLASYANAKARLFELPTLSHLVLNANDPFSAALARRAPRGSDVIGASVDARALAELVGEIRRTGLDGTELAISGKFGGARLRSALIGEFNAENVLLALGALLANDVPLSHACAALEQAHAPPGRMEVLGGRARQPFVVVDYAHTPDALQRVLTVLTGLARGDVWCVFGCGGERDRGKRPLMGQVAARLADHVVLTDDNPRAEDPVQIVDEIRAGLADLADVTIEHDRSTAIHLAVQRAAPSDVVLIAGKGHEATQVAGSLTRPFSDRAVALDALGDRP